MYEIFKHFWVIPALLCCSVIIQPLAGDEGNSERIWRWREKGTWILVQKALDSQGQRGTSEQVGPKADKVVKKSHCQCCEEFEGEDF